MVATMKKMITIEEFLNWHIDKLNVGMTLKEVLDTGLDRDCIDMLRLHDIVQCNKELLTCNYSNADDAYDKYIVSIVKECMGTL